MEHYKFFQNRECEYFPCHAGVDEDSFNCLFCYCPLYALGEKCGGGCAFLDGGIKSCEKCLLPHSPGGYEKIMSKMGEVMRLAGRKTET